MRKINIIFVGLILLIVISTLHTVDSAQRRFTSSEIRQIVDLYKNSTQPTCNSGDLCFNVDEPASPSSHDGNKTANAICRKLGYEKYINFTEDSNGFTSPGDNGISHWDESLLNFTCTCALTHNHAFLQSLTCYKPDCIPLTTANCSNLGYQCGSWADGCTPGQNFSCGSCNTGYQCSLIGKCTRTFPDCADDQLILRMTKDTNAKASFWNMPGLNYKLCYNMIFGENYTGTDLHTCNAYNRIIKLEGQSDSLSEVKTGSAYSQNICFGDMYCHNETSPGLNCADVNEKVALRLSKDTGANITISTDSSFPIKICCSRGAPPSGTNAYFTNMNERKISNADLDDTVKLYFKGTGLTGKNVIFELYRISSPEVMIFNVTKNSINDNKVTINWKANETGTYIFKARVIGSSDYLISETIVISDVPINNMPVIGIISPKDKSLNRTGIDIIFSAIFSDEDDELNSTWDFGDGNQLRKQNCMSDNCNTTHSYSTKGTKSISLQVKEAERENIVSEYKTVFIYDSGINVFPYIESPSINSILPLTSPIKFNASRTYAASCVLGTCAAPLGSSCYDVHGLNCFNFNKTKMPNEFNIIMSWNFSEVPAKIGNYSDFNQNVEFEKIFYSAKKQWATLKAAYKINSQEVWSDNVIRNFETFSVYPRCEAAKTGSSNWVNLDINGLEVKSSSLDNCYKIATNGEAKACCPLNKRCNIDNECEESFIATKCSDYNSSYDCSRYNDQIPVNELNLLNGNGFCESIKKVGDCYHKVSYCSCKWDSSERKCNPTFNYSKALYCGAGVDYREPYSNELLDYPEGCTIKTSEVQNNCESTGFITYTRKGEWSSTTVTRPIECPEEKTINIPCEEAITLNFFGYWNFIFTIGIICIIYMLIITKNKKSHRVLHPFAGIKV